MEEKIRKQKRWTEVGSGVVLMKHNKKVGRGILKAIGRDTEEGVTIHSVRYPPDRNSVEVTSVKQGHGDTELPEPLQEMSTLGDAVGSFVPWSHSQMRHPIEDGSEMDKAWVRLLEDENILSFGTTENCSVESVAETTRDAQEATNNNEKYVDAVTKNSIISNIQAQQYLNYAGHQRELMKLNNSYGNMVDKACRMLDKVDRRMTGQPETKIIYVEFDGEVRKRTVFTYSQLFLEASKIVGGGSFSMSYKENAMNVSICDQLDFDQISDCQLILLTKTPIGGSGEQ